MWKGKEVNYINRQTFVVLLDLSNNVLIGDIPSEITKLVTLDQLNLSRNNLTGFIPQHIGLMKSLDSLDLSRNHLSGVIPTSLSELSFLGVLNLSYNNLYDRIPPQLKFDESSYAGNSELCGRPVLNQSCPGDDDINNQDPNFKSNSNEMNHKKDEFISAGFFISMGLGFIIGFWGIFGAVLLNNSTRFTHLKWLNTIEEFICSRVELIKARLRRRFQN